MKTKSFYLYLILVFLLPFACQKEEVVVPVIKEQMTMDNFAFYRKNNPGLTAEAFLSLEDHRFSGSLPEGARIKELVASFNLSDGSIAFIGDSIQSSGVTANDFSKIVTYRVEKEDGTVEEFEVEITYKAIFPVIEINTEGMQKITSKDEYINASIEVKGGNQFGDLSGQIKIRGRGNSTWVLHPKKPYQIKFDEKTEMLGMPEDKRWLLLAEYSDKTFLRNQIAFELGYRSILDWTPQSEFAEVVLNGNPQGLYVVCQKVEESSNRVDIGDEGFLLEIDQLDRLDEGDIYFYTDHFLLNIKEPDLVDKGEQYEYVRQFIQQFETALFSSSFKIPATGYRKYIEAETVVDWFLINEIAKNVDAMWFASIFMSVVPGEKMKFGPIWDFDLGFGNVDYAASQFPTGWWVKENPWISRMLQDPYFKSLVKERYAYFRSFEYDIYENMDQKSSYFYQSQKKNDDIWHTIGKYVWPNPKVFPTYEGELEYLKQWLQERLAWMDGAMEDL